MRRTFVVLALASILAACSSNPTGPSPVAPTPEESASNGPVNSTAYDPFLKQRISFTVEGNEVVARFRMPYNEDIGNAWLLVFDRGSNPQRFIAASGPHFIAGPQGTDYALSVEIGSLCNRPLQADLYKSDRLTEAMKNNQFNGSLLLGADTNLQSEPCPGPRPSPSPTPDPTCETNPELCDVCPNIEGQQPEVPEGYYLDEEGQCVKECDEEGSWVAQEPTYEYGEWGECGENLEASTGNHNPPSCSRSRTVTVIVYEVNSCTQERREKSRESRQESEPCECPPPPTPDYCYYNISGGPIFKLSFCLGTGGEWGNWNGQGNHCRYDFPGISSSFANLTPGQSASGCLSKHDD